MTTRFAIIVLGAVFAASPASSQTTAKAPPDALIDQVIKDTNVTAQVSLTLDNGYGVGLDSWDGRKTDIRKQVLGRQIDLNGDKVPEWLVIISSHVTCSESQIDCRLLVYSGEKEGYRRLWGTYRLGTGPIVGGEQLAVVKAGPAKTNGWLDLSWPALKPAMRGQTTTLKYDGKEYK
jgi:hypothetical protein